MTATVVHDPLIQEPVIPMDASHSFTFVVAVSVDYTDPQQDDPDATKGPVLSREQVEGIVRELVETSLRLPCHMRLEITAPDETYGEVTVKTDYEIQEAYVE